MTIRFGGVYLVHLHSLQDFSEPVFFVASSQPCAEKLALSKLKEMYDGDTEFDISNLPSFKAVSKYLLDNQQYEITIQHLEVHHDFR